MGKFLNRYFLYLHKYKERILRKKARKGGCYGLCLMFHDVYKDKEQIVEAVSDLAISVDFFKAVIAQLKNEGYLFVDIKEGLNILENRIKCKFVIITFDDVPSNVLQYAYPILQNERIPFTMFVSCNYLDIKGFVNREQLQILSQNNLCTIGCHSLTHSMLRNNKECVRELSDSKTALESLIGCDVKYFAYPYGSCYAVDKKTISTTNIYYEAAFSTLDAPLSPSALRNKFFLPRVLVTPNSRFNEYI